MTKNLSQKILIFCFIIAILVAPFLYTNNNILNEVSAYSSTSGLTQSEKAITVDEIWNGTSFNKQNLQIFTDKIFRSITNLSYLSTTYGVSNYNIKSKNSAKELVVKIGGLDWIVSYISRANHQF